MWFINYGEKLEIFTIHATGRGVFLKVPNQMSPNVAMHDVLRP